MLLSTLGSAMEIDANDETKSSDSMSTLVFTEVDDHENMLDKEGRASLKEKNTSIHHLQGSQAVRLPCSFSGRSRT